MNPGRHLFEVQAKSLFGALSDSPASVAFAVAQPLHKNPLIIAGAALWVATICGLALFHRRRRHRNAALVWASERRLRTLLEQIPICIHEVDLEGRLMSMNPAGVKMLGLDEEAQVIGKPYLDAVVEQDREHVAQLMEQARRGQESVFSFRAIVASGETRSIDSSLVPVRSIDGEVVRIVGYSQDVTVKAQAEEERRRLEGQLRQAQKMEAIGQLAGGVAHDFNNLLTVIAGYAELMRDQPDEAGKVVERATQIEKASEQAAALTSQLLAFSRRQVLQPTVLSVAEVVSDVEQMLRRLISEDIDLSVDLSATGSALVDRAQFKQVIINLVVNARDSLGSGGRIEVAARDRDIEHPILTETTEIPVGRYVVLEVSDTGSGIDTETRKRIFEPFYTTKDLGKGTGLGLSTVYGIVSQSAGFVMVDSELGTGTRLSVYLPRVGDCAELALQPFQSRKGLHGSETVLVVEDSEEIRRLIGRTLENAGYTVLCAPDGIAATQIAEQHPEPIGLLLTDLVMPRLSGGLLAQRFRKLRPGAAVVYMSGYAERLAHTLIEDPTIPMLEKPFRLESLLRQVRAALDEPQNVEPVKPMGSTKGP